MSVTLSDALVENLSRFSYRWRDEYDLQNSLESVLSSLGYDYEREARLSARDRIDFLVGDVGIECKVNGSVTAVESQLRRYLESERVDRVLLVTGKVHHRAIDIANVDVLWVGGVG